MGRRGRLGEGIIGAGTLLKAVAGGPKKARHPWMIPLFRLSGWSFVAMMIGIVAYLPVDAVAPGTGLTVLAIMGWCLLVSVFSLWGHSSPH